MSPNSHEHCWHLYRHHRSLHCLCFREAWIKTRSKIALYIKLSIISNVTILYNADLRASPIQSTWKQPSSSRRHHRPRCAVMTAWTRTGFAVCARVACWVVAATDPVFGCSCVFFVDCRGGWCCDGMMALDVFVPLLNSSYVKASPGSGWRKFLITFHFSMMRRRRSLGDQRISTRVDNGVRAGARFGRTPKTIGWFSFWHLRYP